MNITTRQHLTRLAALATTAGLAATLVAPASAAPADTHTSSDAASQQLSARYQQNMVLNWYGDDGAKGTIKNKTSHTVRVSDPLHGTEGVYTLIPPGGQVIFFDSKEFDYRDGRDIILSGEGASLTFRRSEGGGDYANLTLSDPYIGRPDTLFRSWPVKNLRKGWSEGVTHHENTATASFEVKREKDGPVGGGYDRSENSDWAVFTITINKI